MSTLKIILILTCISSIIFMDYVLYTFRQEIQASTINLYYQLSKKYQQQHNYTKAILWLEKARYIQQKQKKKAGILINIYQQLGTNHLHQKAYRQALYYYKKSLKAHLEYSKPKARQLSNHYNRLGIAHQKLSQYDKSILWYTKAYQQLQKLANSSCLLIDSCQKLVLVHYQKRNYQAVFAYYQKAVNISLATQCSIPPLLSKLYKKSQYYLSNHPTITKKSS